MSKKGFKVSSLTYAMKGRDILLKKGYKAYLTRNPHPKGDEGCGYIICVSNFDIRCKDILERGGIKVIGTINLEV